MTSTGTIGGNRFAQAIKFVLAHETEYNSDGSVRTEHDKHDPGGTTRYGIDQRAHPHVDVANLTLEQAEQIYFDGEWTKCRCGELNPPWDLALFDAAVNVGSSRAVKWLQKAVRVEVDGFIGPKTIAAVNASAADEFLEFIELRRHYYSAEVRTALRLRYLKGWLARVDELVNTSNIETGTMLA